MTISPDIYQLWRDKQDKLLSQFAEIKGSPLTEVEKAMVDCAFHKGAKAMIHALRTGKPT